MTINGEENNNTQILESEGNNINSGIDLSFFGLTSLIKDKIIKVLNTDDVITHFGEKSIFAGKEIQVVQINFNTNLFIYTEDLSPVSYTESSRTFENSKFIYSKKEINIIWFGKKCLYRGREIQEIKTQDGIMKCIYTDKLQLVRLEQHREIVSIGNKRVYLGREVQDVIIRNGPKQTNSCFYTDDSSTVRMKLLVKDTDFYVTDLGEISTIGGKEIQRVKSGSDNIFYIFTNDGSAVGVKDTHDMITGFGETSKLCGKEIQEVNIYNGRKGIIYTNDLSKVYVKDTQEVINSLGNKFILGGKEIQAVGNGFYIYTNDLSPVVVKGTKDRIKHLGEKVVLGGKDIHAVSITSGKKFYINSNDLSQVIIKDTKMIIEAIGKSVELLGKKIFYVLSNYKKILIFEDDLSQISFTVKDSNDTITHIGDENNLGGTDVCLVKTINNNVGFCINKSDLSKVYVKNTDFEIIEFREENTVGGKIVQKVQLNNNKFVYIYKDDLSPVFIKDTNYEITDFGKIRKLGQKNIQAVEVNYSEKYIYIYKDEGSQVFVKNTLDVITSFLKEGTIGGKKIQQVEINHSEIIWVYIQDNEIISLNPDNHVKDFSYNQSTYIFKHINGVSSFYNVK